MVEITLNSYGLEIEWTVLWFSTLSGGRKDFPIVRNGHVSYKNTDLLLGQSKSNDLLVAADRPAGKEADVQIGVQRDQNWTMSVIFDVFLGNSKRILVQAIPGQRIPFMVTVHGSGANAEDTSLSLFGTIVCDSRQTLELGLSAGGNTMSGS